MQTLCCSKERELAPVIEWNRTAIEARRARMLDWARGRWHVEPATAPADVSVEDDERDEVEEVAGAA
jgi:hypothetical protein